MKIVVSFSLSENLIRKIDEERGLASRSAVVEDIIREKYHLKKYKTETKT